MAPRQLPWISALVLPLALPVVILGASCRGSDVPSTVAARGDASSRGAAALSDAGGSARMRDAARTGSDTGAEGDDTFFTAQMKAARVPGMAVAVVKNGAIGWSKGYGMADIAAHRAVTPDTLFMLASISKTFVAVALMQLIEDPSRQLFLDQPIASQLPFQVKNPLHPDADITYRMLLTHSSSLIDSSTVEEEPFVPGDAKTSLHDWLSSYVSRKDSWSAAAPGRSYAYSNAGASLAGYLVERISGQNLQDYCRAHVFAPLGMNESSWFLRGLDDTHIAMPYEYEKGVFTPQGQYGFPDYPDGQLRTSATQLARFLIMFAQRGQYAGVRVLKEDTALEMRRQQTIGGRHAHRSSSQGLIWYYDDDGDTRVLGHNGSYYGVSTDMWFDPKTGAGYVLLSNGGTYLDDDEAPQQAMTDMNERLIEIAESLP